jgi:hypothetical protein
MYCAEDGNTAAGALHTGPKTSASLLIDLHSSPIPIPMKDRRRGGRNIKYNRRDAVDIESKLLSNVHASNTNGTVLNDDGFKFMEMDILPENDWSNDDDEIFSFDW